MQNIFNNLSGNSAVLEFSCSLLLHLTDYALPTLPFLFWLTPKLDSVFSLFFFSVFLCVSLFVPCFPLRIFSSVKVCLRPCPLSPLVSVLHPPCGDNSPTVRVMSTMVHLWGLHPLQRTVGSPKQQMTAAHWANFLLPLSGFLAEILQIVLLWLVI